MGQRITQVTYRWPDDALIRRVEVREQANGRAVAYLYADERPELHADRLKLREAIRAQGWGTLSDHREGGYALRIGGLQNADALLSFLRNQRLIASEPQVTRQVLDENKPKNLIDGIKQNSLRLSAAIYALGDFFYFKGSNNAFDKGMALSFGFGDVMLGIFGGRDEDRQFRSLLTQYKKHLDKEGVAIPEKASINVETAQFDQGVLGNGKEFLNTHINTIKILSEVVGGGFVLRSGLDREKTGPRAGKRNPFNIVSGLVIMAGWVGALVVKEKKPDPERKPEGPVDAIANHFQEKPLRLAGYAGLTFNGLRITDNWLNKRPTSKWNFSGVASMIGANTLYSMSNKAPGGDIRTQAMVGDVYIVAAQILNKQPENVREAAIESTVKFLGERPEIRDSAGTIRARLREEMQLQRQSPWFEDTPLAAYTPQPKKQPRVPALETDTPSTQIQAPATHEVAAALPAAERSAAL